MKINCKVFPLLHAFISIYFQDKSLGSELTFGHPTHLFSWTLVCFSSGRETKRFRLDIVFQPPKHDKIKNNRNNKTIEIKQAAERELTFFISRFKLEANRL